MAIKNSLDYKGLSVAGAYSRIAEVTVDSRQPSLRVTLAVEDYANEAAAAKVLEDVTRVETPAYDASNPEHNRQWLANGGLDAAGKELPVDPSWKPTIYVTEKKWLGKRAQDPLQERTLELPLELALQIVLQTVPGATPDGTADNLTSQAYRAALALPGAFVSPVSV